MRSGVLWRAWRRRWAEWWHCKRAAGMHRAAWPRMLVVGTHLGVDALASGTRVMVMRLAVGVVL